MLPVVISLALALGAIAEGVVLPTSDGGVVYADVYGTGNRAVILAHGGRFNKESWGPQAQALSEAGFKVLALDFRGYGQSRGPAGRPEDEGLHLDIVAAIRYLRNSGATSVSVIGASMGGDYAAEAAEAEPDSIDRLVLLAAGAYTPLTRSRARKLFVMSREDIIGDNELRLPAIRDQYERALGPKVFITLEGSAHAQALFETEHADRVMREILSFLSAP